MSADTPTPAAGPEDFGSAAQAVQGAGHPNGTNNSFKGHPMTQTQEQKMREEIADLLFEKGIGVVMPGSRHRFVNVDEAAEAILSKFSLTPSERLVKAANFAIDAIGTAAQERARDALRAALKEGA